ncbi:tetratricopeptide repeat protein [Streptomyces sp. NRRL B-24484]|uniref:tetratricopeptide repeat protein n=1 Tax=Streptomyces sp. NRRL B-24484 TaxID=1463833 RepID=UPI000694901B|nr:tetratricopeptide repeat protein [Streptomyces sp. NRRL B-24484]
MERLQDTLSAAGLGLTALELAEVLWLAARIPAPGAAGATGTPTATTSPPHRPPGNPSGADAPAHGSVPGTAGGTDVYAMAGAPVEGTAATPVLVRAERALPAPRRLARALRPLKRPVRSPREQELDERATADLVADTGVFDLVTRARRERWMDVALVIDDGLSMHIWRELSAELRVLLQNAGIFRRVRTYGLDTRHPEGPRLYSRPFDPHGVRLPAGSPCPSDGRGLVLVLSDAVGAGWRDGRLDRLLAHWARSCATAVLQPLPKRLWPGTGLRTETKQLRAGRAGTANSAWRVTDPVLPADLAPFSGLPVPVVELDPASIAAWALLVAHGTGTSVQVAEVTPAAPQERPTPAPAGTGPATDMRSRLTLFRSAASPEAFRLAGHLAAVRPLTLPVMRLVQRAVLGNQGSPAHLAEVLLGGLLRRAPADPAPTGHPHPQRYDFRPGLRELLLESVPTGAALSTAALVTDLWRSRTPDGRDTPALRAALHGTGALPPGAGAFARTDTPLLGHFGPGGPPSTGDPIDDVPFGALADHHPQLATLVADQRWPEAVELGEHVLEQLLTELGPHHPTVLGGRFDLAEWIGAGGAQQTALQLCRELCTHLAARLGPDHDRVLTLRARTGHWTGLGGDPAAAAAVFRELLPDQQRLRGPDHPDCLTTRHQIAFWTAQSGDVTTTLALFQELLLLQRRVLGPDTRETLSTRANIASYTGQCGRSAEALELWQALLPDIRRVLGPDDLLLLVTEAEIGHWSGMTGDPAAALRLIPPAIPRLTELLGPHHPSPYGFRRRLAQWTGELGDTTEALRLLRDLLGDLGRGLAPEHPTFLGVRAEFAYWTARSGDLDTGLRQLRDLLPELTGILGPDHPDTRWVRETIDHLTTPQD